MKLREMQNMKTVKTPKKFYLVYARKSSESEDHQLASIDNQIDVLQETIKSKKLTILQTFRESHSAKAPGRPAFNEMIALIDKRNDIKGIVCWKLNRLSRNPIDSGKLQWLIQSGKIEEIVTPHQTYLEADSDFVMGIEAAQSNRFIRDLREDTKRGINRKLENGNAPILAPAGYLNDMTKRQGERDIIPHPKYFKLMRRIFEMALTGKYSTADLTRESRLMGIVTNRGEQLGRTQMYRILTNPFYTGRFIYSDTCYQGSHLPMINDTEFDTIQDVLSGRSFTKKVKNEYPFTGYILCGHCKTSHMAGERHVKKSGKEFYYYKCSAHSKGLCPQPYISAEELDKQVFDFLGSIKISENLLKVAVRWVEKTDANDKTSRFAQYDAMKDELKSLDTKVSLLTKKWLSSMAMDSPILSDQDFQEIKQDLLHQKRVIEDKLKSGNDDFETWTDLSIETLKFAARAQKKWDTGTIDDKKTILSVIGVNLVLTDKKLDITPKTPFLLINKALKHQKYEYQGVNQFAEATLGLEYAPNATSGVGEATLRELMYLPNLLREHYSQNPLEAQSMAALLLEKPEFNYATEG